LERPVKIRQLAVGDLDAVISIQARSPEAARWLRADYQRATQGDFTGWVAEDETGVIAFLIARLLSDEMEILNLAVAAEARRRGAGSLLLKESLVWGRQAGARRAFLEVRESNGGAIKFYRRHGFAEASRRSRYYTDPIEDALVLAIHLA
jgi:[ribosomal protein S18]-alanine N-acetyltransferase